MAKGRNKGEYSELLAFLRILHAGRIQLADKNGNPRPEWIKVISVSQPNRPEVSYKIKDAVVEGSETSGAPLCTLSRDSIGELADSLYLELKNSKGASFECRSAQIARDQLGLTTLTSSSNKKSDIIVRAASIFSDGEGHSLGFSIKSEIGGLPTLMNAGATIFKYKLLAPQGCDPFQVQEEIPRSTRKHYPGPMKLLPALSMSGVNIQFECVENKVFEQNLKMIDTEFPWILSTILKHAYIQQETGLGLLLDSPDLISEIASRLALPETMTRILIRHKIKDLLRQSALGMMPSKPWGGEVEAHGGWIIVRNDGSVICYHLANDDEFREFLLGASKIETPSTSRHEAGYVYRQEEDGSPALNLSLQIRFS